MLRMVEIVGEKRSYVTLNTEVRSHIQAMEKDTMREKEEEEHKVTKGIWDELKIEFHPKSKTKFFSFTMGPYL